MAQAATRALLAVALAGGCSTPPRLDADASVADGGANERDGANDAFVSPDASVPSDARVIDEDAARTLVQGCGGAPEPWAGPLTCVDGACALAASELVDPGHFRNDRPSLAIGPRGEPSILYTTAEGGYVASLATRSGGTFTSTRLAETAAVGALVYGSLGCGYAFLNDGAFGSGLYRVEGTTLTPLYTRPNRMIAGGRLVLARDGSLRAIGLAEPDWTGFVARLDGTWTEAPIPRAPIGYSTPGSLAVGPDGSVHVAWLDATSSALIWYARDEGPAESVGGGTGSGAGRPLHGPAVELAVGGDGTTRILFGTLEGDAVLATRSGGPSGAWTTEPLFAGESTSSCGSSPTRPDETCASHEVSWTPLGLVSVASGDSVGLVSRNQVDTTFRSECHPGGPGPGGPGGCTFAVTSSSTTLALDVVAVARGVATTRLLADDVGGAVGTMALGPDGHLHVATYEPREGGYAVRHLEIAPSP